MKTQMIAVDGQEKLSKLDDCYHVTDVNDLFEPTMKET